MFGNKARHRSGGFLSLFFFIFTWMNIQDFISIKALVFPFLLAALTELLNFLSAEHVYKRFTKFQTLSVLTLFDSIF